MDQSRLLTEIEPGFYQMKLVRGGPFVPVLVEQHGMELSITINGVRQEQTYHVDGVEDRIAASMLMGEANRDPLVRIHWAERITQDRYKRLLGVLEYCKIHLPDHPMMTPTKPCNLSSRRSLW